MRSLFSSDSAESPLTKQALAARYARKSHRAIYRSHIPVTHPQPSPDACLLSCVPNIAVARCMESWLTDATGTEITAPSLQTLIGRLQAKERQAGTTLPEPAFLPSTAETAAASLVHDNMRMCMYMV